MTTLIDQAKQAFANQQFAQAIELGKQNLKDHPNDVITQELLIDSYYYTLNPQAVHDTAREMLAYNPNHAYAYFAIGCADSQVGRYEQALAHFQHAYALDKRPSYQTAILCTSQQLALQPEQQWAILQDYDRFLRQYPNDLGALANRAILLGDMGLHELAQQDLQRNLQLNKDPIQIAKASLNLGINKLRLGEYEEGWALFEHRWQAKHAAAQRPNWDTPIWQGEDIGNAPLLVCAEQGFGDNIQFVRYAIAAKQLGYNVTVLNQPQLEDLISGSLKKFGIPTISLNGEQPQGFSYYATMMSMPHLLRHKIGSQPVTGHGYLQTSPAYQQKWATKMQPEKTQPRIGIVWAGSPKHHRNLSRSITLNTIAPLLQFPAEFHCLQKDISPEDLAQIQQYPNLHTWAHEIQDFSDTAALAEQMDLVISVDTSVAHLAAAIGKPTWTLISHNPDYRWLLDRRDTPWYPSMTLFRQPENLSWGDVVAQILKELQGYFQAA
ncbi:tetratricopeptide repeat-containing glycosyltransferase family protein [Kingella negevensis]|uniref:tetratricopeptide repeat-containing glycosyltransferase family protein n=1 Tax=Kingella negevensis TaxID=1522312 RepID=UPI0025428B07|nr:tetratricopeptide repeat-containing glycosyltransferase family protein [Kingella negevensis]WII92512.1 tetratricopeptide repeat-containing glycosyltransferase family protein [Kingella negevensis]